ncbi:transposase, partial [bacterium AH-315-P11]|nr:transposase [bacterium AH-315-P11]
MKQTVTLARISTATGIHRTSVQRKLDKNETPFIWHNGISGKEKRYFASNLPRNLRFDLAKDKATPATEDLNLQNKAAQVGTAAAHKMLEDAAEEKERLQMAKEDGLAVFDHQPEMRKAEAWARHDFLSACSNFVLAARYKIRKGSTHSKKGSLVFIENYNGGHINLGDDIHQVVGEKISYSTLNRWRKSYDKLGLIGLVNNYHNPNKGKSSLSKDHKEYIVGLVTDNPMIKVTNIEKGLQGHFGFSIPSYAVINRYYEKWIRDHRMQYEHLTNPDKWKNHSMVAYGSASETIIRLNQMWEADSTPADLMLTDGRYNLINTIDIFSRRVKFHVCKTSKASAIAALTRRCIIDWGVPEIIKTDNGQDYKSKYLRQVIKGLGVEQIFCKPFSGEEKPHSERVFKTFLHSIVEMMPEYIGHNVSERQAIEARRSFADRIMKKGGDPVEANISSEELQRICDEWTEYIYHHDKHGGLNGKKPIEMVRAWNKPIRHISNMRALDMLLMQAPTDGGKRKIGKKGVKVDGKYYHSVEMTEHKGQVKVLLDPTDMGTIYLYQKDTLGEMRFLCIGINPDWYGIDKAEFASMSKRHQMKFIKASKRELTKKAKELGTKNAYKEYMERRKS